MSKCFLGIEQPCEECRMCAAEGFRKAVEYVKDGGESYHTTAYPEGV